MTVPALADPHQYQMQLYLLSWQMQGWHWILHMHNERNLRTRKEANKLLTPNHNAQQHGRLVEGWNTPVAAASEYEIALSTSIKSATSLSNCKWTWTTRWLSDVGERFSLDSMPQQTIITPALHHTHLRSTVEPPWSTASTPIPFKFRL